MLFGHYPGYIRDRRAQRGVGLRVDGISRYRDDIRLIFDLEIERTPLQPVGDEVALNTRRLLPGAFHLDDEWMNFMMLAIIRKDVDHRSGVRLDEDLFFESTLLHEVIIL